MYSTSYSDLHALDVDCLQFTPNGILFRILGLTKIHRSGLPKEAFFTSFEEDPGLYLVATLIAYEGTTEKWRSQDMKPNYLLFLSLNEPHKSVASTSTIRGIKELLMDVTLVCIPTQFSAYSIWVAASSSARAAGLYTADVHQRWLVSHNNLYLKPLPQTNYAN